MRPRRIQTEEFPNSGILSRNRFASTRDPIAAHPRTPHASIVEDASSPLGWIPATVL
jgi:hypothetical protein